VAVEVDRRRNVRVLGACRAAGRIGGREAILFRLGITSSSSDFHSSIYCCSRIRERVFIVFLLVFERTKS
jgi:hypothetical protein